MMSRKCFPAVAFLQHLPPGSFRSIFHASEESRVVEEQQGRAKKSKDQGEKSENQGLQAPGEIHLA